MPRVISFQLTISHQVFNRLDAFLPQLAAANQQLAERARQDPESVNMEHINDTDNQYIQMVRTRAYRAAPGARTAMPEYVSQDLGLGVFEQRRPSSAQPDSQDSVKSDASDSDSDSDHTQDSDSHGSPHIVVLSESIHEQSI